MLPSLREWQDVKKKMCVALCVTLGRNALDIAPRMGVPDWVS
jgi:hypothetical protein